MRTHGVPREILTDNGKVFTGRFGPGTGEVLFDRICRENGIKHILTAPRSPTTTGKVERWHKTLRREFLNGKVFESIADAQAQLDRWVHSYNHERRHQGIGMSCRGNGSGSPLPSRSSRSSSTDGADRRHGGSAAPARSASPRRRIRSGCGSPVRPSRCPSPTGSSVDPPPRRARRHPRPAAPAGQGAAGAALARSTAKRPRPRQATVGQTRDPQGRLVGQRVSFAGDELPGRHERTSAARSRSRSSATPSRSPPAARSSSVTRSATTAPASTAPSPTPAADPHRINAA